MKHTPKFIRIGLIDAFSPRIWRVINIIMFLSHDTHSQLKPQTKQSEDEEEEEDDDEQEQHKKT